jgi:cytochrome c-type biogenesis protein CcmF
VSLALLGSVALWVSIAACGLSLLGAVTKRVALARVAAVVAAWLAGISCGILLVALLTGDFSLDYVVRTTSLSTPWPYRASALWGAMEGSLLFYATLSLAIGVIAAARIDEKLRSRACSVVALVGGGLLLLTALMANPFVTLDIPAVDGEGLVAILQHPAMVYHPPILYFGLTSLLVPFAITVAALGQRSLDQVWIQTTRRWVLLSWTVLTFGIVAGANWAYVELGWGGFWAWDPVENTSLMPWIVATIFLHTSRIQLRDGRLARWNASLAMLPFALTVLGVYLTRSGVTGSVHAFAESEEIGMILLTLFLVVVGFVLWQGLRAPRGSVWDRVRPWGRDTWLGAQGGILGIVLVFVFIGSAYPAYISVFTGAKTSVDPTFYVTLILPMAFLILMGAALAMRTSWIGDSDDISAGVRLLALFIVMAIGLACVTLGFTASFGFLLLVLAIASSAVLAADLIRRRPPGRILVGYVAHLGLALVLVGAGGSSLGAQFRGGMAPGDVVAVGGYEVRLDRVETGEEGRFIYVAADLTLLRDGQEVDTVRPQIRAYEDQPLPIPEPVLRSTPMEDIVFAISRVNQDASGVEVSVFVKPLVFWVWAGGLLIALAGVAGLTVPNGAGGERRREATSERPGRDATNAT